MSFLRQYLVALQFFTRLPVTGALGQWVGFSPELLRASAAHFPGVGWLVGLVACSVFALLGLLLPESPFAPLVAAVGSTVATVLFTGGFHEDGLADVADGLGGSAERDRALEIMKDSRLGTYGTLAIVLVLLSKISLLAVLAADSPVSVLLALWGAHVISRFWPLLLVRTMAYVGDANASKSKPLADRIDSKALLVAAAWCLPPIAVLFWVEGFAFIGLALLSSAIALFWMRRLFARRLQGFTGDCLGATQQVCEAAFYLGTAVALGFA